MLFRSKAMRPKNDRNAANPRPGSPALKKMAKDKALPPTPPAEKKPMITIPREPGMTPYEQYRRDMKVLKEAKEQKEKLRKQHEEETRFQEECWEELRKKRCEEYVSFQNMVAILDEITGHSTAQESLGKTLTPHYLISRWSDHYRPKTK